MIVCNICLQKLSKADFYVEAPQEQDRKFTPYASVGTMCCNSGEAIRIDDGYDVADLIEQELSRHNEDIFQEVDTISIEEYQNL